jgi:excisionase family DNA binding protein
MTDLVSNQAVPATYTVAEAAAILGISKWLYYNLAKKGEVPVLVVGRRSLVPRNQLEAFLAGQCGCSCHGHRLAAQSLKGAGRSGISSWAAMISESSSRM